MVQIPAEVLVTDKGKKKIDAFYIDRYEVTQKQYKKVTGENPSFFKGGNRPSVDHWAQS